jgi:hypothetical protein
MKKLLLLLLLFPLLIFAQEKKIYNESIEEIIYITNNINDDGNYPTLYYDIPEGKILQPFTSSSVFKIDNDGGYTLVSDNHSYALIPSGYAVLINDGLSGVLYSAFKKGTVIYESDIDTDNASVNITVPEGKFWYILKQQESSIYDPTSGYQFVIPGGTEVSLTTKVYYSGNDQNGDGVIDESEAEDINADGVIDFNDGQISISFINAIEYDIASFNELLSSINPSPLNKVILFPNPTSSFLTFDSNKNYDIEVYDLSGKKMMSVNGNSINIEHLSSAIYFVKIKDLSNNEEQSYKVVKN